MISNMEGPPTGYRCTGCTQCHHRPRYPVIDRRGESSDLGRCTDYLHCNVFCCSDQAMRRYVLLQTAVSILFATRPHRELRMILAIRDTQVVGRPADIA